MFKKFALAVTFAMISASTLVAATVPPQAHDRIPCDLLPSWAVDALAAGIGVCG
jgi:hypothetical protein